MATAPTIFSIAVFVLTVTRGKAFVQKVSVDAAYTDNDYIDILFGDQISFIEKTSKSELITLKLKEINVPQSLFQLDRQAAFSTLDSYLTKNVSVLFYGSKEGVDVTFEPHKIKDSAISYGSGPNFVSGGGPDAAAKKGDKVYFFKGDQVALFKDNQWESPVSTGSLGLPCDVDAAWSDGDAMVLLRGNQVWRWEADNSVSGPTGFMEIYHTWSWEPVAKPAKNC